MHWLVTNDAWSTGEGLWESRMELSLARMSNELARWQQELARGGRQKITKVGNLDKKSFGTKARPGCSLKGAETNYVLEYLVERFLLQKYLADMSLPRRSRIPLDAARNLFPQGSTW